MVCAPRTKPATATGVARAVEVCGVRVGLLAVSGVLLVIGVSFIGTHPRA